METPPSEATNLDNIKTAEDLLAALRKGNAQELMLGFGELKVPCRLLNATEEATLVVKAKVEAIKANPGGEKGELFEAAISMKSILLAATTFNGTAGFPRRFLDLLSSAELDALYDQYVSLNRTINPNIESLTQAQILELVESIKKKEKKSKDLFSYQQAAIGIYFLDVILPMLLTANAATTP